MRTKRCSRCSIEKSIEHFSKTTRNKDGLKFWCKECVHQYYLDNKKMIAESVRKYDALHTDKRRENVMRYYWGHREQRLSYARNYRIKNKTDRIKKDKVYYQNHKEQVANTVRKYNTTPNGKSTKARSTHKRRTRWLSTECTLTNKQWEKILMLQHNRCAICNRLFNSRFKPTRDHIIPISRGGGLSFENVQALCKSCNCSKHDKLDHGKIVTWMQPAVI